MHDALFKYIRSHSAKPLAKHDVNLLKRIFVLKKFRKRQYFLQEGEVCNYNAFIVKGAMRQFSVDEKGVEHIVQLFIENQLVGDRESFLSGAPSPYYIDAWEETDALLISKKDFDAFRNIPAVNETATAMSARHVFAVQRRLHDVISLSAQERYTELLKSAPDLLQRFPQHIIASYLGVTKETLSRIRRQAVKK